MGLMDNLKDSSWRFSFLMALALFSLPIGHRGFSNVCLILLVIHGLIFLQGREWLQALRSPLFTLPAIFLGLYALSLFWSSDVPEGLSQIEIKLSLAIAPLVIVAARHRYESGFKRKALWFFVFGNLFATLYALAIATRRSISHGSFYSLNEAGGKKFHFLYTQLAEPIMHPGYFATFLGFALFSVLHLWFSSSSRNRWLYGFPALLFFVMMVLLQARMNLLALFAVLGAGALIYVFKTRAYRWLLLLLVPLSLLLIFLIAAPSELKQRYFSLPDLSYDISGDDFNSATYRLAEWSSAADVIKEHWLLGAGVGDNRTALWDSYRENRFWKGLEEHFNAHNQYLEIMLATGLLGLISFLSILGYYGRRTWLNGDWTTFASLSFLALCLLTESMLERSWAILLFSSFFPLFITISGREKPR